MDETTTARGGKKKGIIASVKDAIFERRGDKLAPIYDIIYLLLSFIFSRAHVIFGAHPLGIAFLALLPSRVFVATVGAAIGSLTLGGSGVIYAMISVIVVFLRVIISGTADKERAVFSEGLVLRMSAAVIGGFIAAVYEVLLSGFSITTVAFGASMILLPPLAVFVGWWLFDGGPSVRELLFGDGRPLAMDGLRDSEKYALVFYQCSALVSLFILSFSLRQYTLFGIDACYIFASAITLLTARRLGMLRAAAVGFASALSISGAASASFLLLGVVSGFLFKLGLVYALVGGGVVLVGWSAYSSGVTGLVSMLPEYSATALALYPFLRRLDPEKTVEEGVSAEREISDMIGTVALSYKNKYTGELDALSLSLSSLGSVVGRHLSDSGAVKRGELVALSEEVLTRYLNEKSPYATLGDGVSLPTGLCERLADGILKRGVVGKEVFEGYPSLAPYASGMADALNRAASILFEERFRAERDSGYSEYLELLSKLLSAARVEDEREKSLNEELSRALSESLVGAGITLGDVKVFGTRVPHVILAAEDESGKKISSPELKRALEGALGRPLGTPEYYRRGKMALMEASVARSYGATAAYAACARSGEVVSGDTVRLYESERGVFYALLSDGVGTGEDAERASGFLADFLASTDGGHTAIRLANHVIRKRGEEYAATVDIFALDLYTGGAHFMKSGAATSFVKRGGSIFRIKSRGSSALGVMRAAECDRIKIEVGDGDIVVMCSDGVIPTDESPWLYELLAKNPPAELSDYAELILSEAKKRVSGGDDMTVIVVKIMKKR